MYSVYFFRFYFSHVYDLEEGLKPVPKELVDNFKKTKDNDREFGGVAPPLRQPERPLRSLEVFAGCGGLSEGLEQSGVSKAEWAIEFYQPAGEAFKKNHKDCQVVLTLC